MGFPVLGLANAFADYAALASHAVVAIGNNALRQKLCSQLLAAGFALARVVHPRAIASPHAELGVIVNCGAVVDHNAQVYYFGHLGVNACMAGGSVLGDFAWMQAEAALGYGVTLPSGRCNARSG